MKNQCTSVYNQLKRTVKNGFIFAIVLLMQLSAAVYAQETKLSVSVENESLEKVIKTIEKQSEYLFFYNADDIDKNKKISLEKNDSSIEDILKELSFKAGFIYKIKDRHIVLTLSSESSNLDKTQSARKVEGLVIDETGEPVIGANVVEKGTTNGIVTDIDGKFTLEVEDDAILQISYIGYADQEVEVAGRTAFNISMIEDTQLLDEVVVVGYGVQKKVNLTGAIGTVDGSTLEKRSVPNTVSLLQGQLSGVNIVQRSGQPGNEDMAIQVRGLGTYSGAGSAPLVLVNGVQGRIGDLDPNTIESVSVLKDAASAAIYGSRAANGVILVTTKNGSQEKGKFSVRYSLDYGVSSPTKLPDLVTNSVQYMELFNQAKRNSGITGEEFLYPQSIIDLYKDPNRDKTKFPDADWSDIMFSSAATMIHNLSISGGNKTTYNLSLGYTDQEGVMEAFNYERYNFQLNLASEISETFKMGVNLNFNNGIRSQPRNGAQDAFWQTLAHPPTALPYLPDGSGRYTYRAYSWESVRPNQFAANEQLSKLVDYKFTSQLYTDLEIVKGLHWYTKGAINGSFGRNKTFSSTVPVYSYFEPDNASLASYIPGNGLSTDMNQTIYTNIFSYLDYVKSISEHEFGIQVGYSQEENNYYYLKGSRPNYSTDILQELNAGDSDPQYNEGTSNAWGLQSIFGRVKYNYASKYLFEANIRYDGSSRFSKDTRWGVFPSFSAAWRISEENFMQEVKSSWLSDLKLRASWGQLGNQDIGLYPYQSLIKIGNNYPFGGTLTTGAYQSALNNQNISWETTTMSNIGIDITLFDKLSATLEAYQKETTDILRSAQVTGTVGLSAPTINDGAIKNTGLELTLNYRDNVKSGALKGLSYGAMFNISGYRNKVTKFGERQDNGSTIIEEGKPWNTFYLLEWEGIFQTPEEVADHPDQFGEDYGPGDLKFKDQLTIDTDGDGVPDKADGVINNDDRVPMTKGVFPSYTYGLTLSASYKGFDINCFLQGVQGLKGIFGYNRIAGLTPFHSGIAPSKDVAANAWTEQNHSTTMPRLYFSDFPGSERVWNHPSTFLLYDMSYLRVKNLQIGYSLPNSIVNKLKMESFRVYVSGENLLTFTDFPGLDPEKPTGQYLSYPQNKTISFGLNVKF